MRSRIKLFIFHQKAVPKGMYLSFRIEKAIRAKGSVFHNLNFLLEAFLQQPQKHLNAQYLKPLV